MDRLITYDILYAYAAREGRETALFGNCAPAAREAFVSSLVEQGFPELWFELPLVGEPWFDFHSLTSYSDVAGTESAYPGHSGAYQNALSWFANQEANKVRQLALSYDTSAGNVESPAVQLLVNQSDASLSLGFLQAVGCEDLCDAYAGFVQNMPKYWYACYTGVFPGRDASGVPSWVRVECLTESKCQSDYAHDVSMLRKHLADVGMEDFSDELPDGVQMLAQSPFPLELQFNVGANGDALPSLSASLRFQPKDWADKASRESIEALLCQVQDVGLADDRWKLLADTCFAKKLKLGDESCVISCFPAFIKLRWRKDVPADAKTYLMAQVS